MERYPNAHKRCWNVSHTLVIVGNTPIIMYTFRDRSKFERGICQIFGEISKTLGERWSWSSWCDGGIRRFHVCCLLLGVCFTIMLFRCCTSDYLFIKTVFSVLPPPPPPRGFLLRQLRGLLTGLKALSAKVVRTPGPNWPLGITSVTRCNEG